VTEFGRRRGLHSSYFFVWKKRLRETPAARFLEVKVTERASISSDSRIVPKVGEGSRSVELRASELAMILKRVPRYERSARSGNENRRKKSRHKKRKKKKKKV
jgi:hypothetical protein